MPNSLAVSLPPPPNIPQPQQPAVGGGAAINPAPSHGEAVAALRHFQAMGRAIFSLLKNPNLGKADIKSDMIDATTKLVAQRIMPARQAVTLMGQLPDNPFQQKQWIKQLFSQNMLAQIAVLDHHRKNNQGSGDLAQESMQHVDNSDQHVDVMNGMMQSHYGGGSA